MNEDKKVIVVSVSGGCVQSVRTDAEGEFVVQLFDWDDQVETPEEEEAKLAEFNDICDCTTEVPFE